VAKLVGDTLPCRFSVEPLVAQVAEPFLRPRFAESVGAEAFNAQSFAGVADGILYAAFQRSPH